MEGEERKKNRHVAHCVVLGFPAQGHITPVLQFSKRLAHKGVKVTLVSTFFFCKTLAVKSFISDTNITLETISDGFDDGGIASAESSEAYFDEFERVAPPSLSALLHRLASSGLGVDCVVYDGYMRWVVDVAKKHGLCCACFLTQSCAVCSLYLHAYKKTLKVPVVEEEGDVELPGLPPLSPSDLPSFLYRPDSYPLFLRMSVDQFANIDEADWVLANTFYELEHEVVEWMQKMWRMKTIGPTVPSTFLDGRVEVDKDYGISMFEPNDKLCLQWLDGRPRRSVVYVSFGSIAGISGEQMTEMGRGLVESGCHFLWVVRAAEEGKLPKGLMDDAEKGMVVRWCPQLQVLSHEAVGCFVTHCGWNSTLEALCLGVPMACFSLWSDQSTNAKYVSDVWKVGMAPEREARFTREEVKRCLKEIMEGGKGREMKKNALYWRGVARAAVDEGGSSDKNIDEFVNTLLVRSV